MNFTFPHGLGNARRHYSEIVPRYGEFMEVLLQALDSLEGRGISAVTEAVPLCLLGGKWRERATELLYASAVRSVTIQLDEGRRDWSTDRVASKTKDGRCRWCVLDRYCEGVWSEYASLHGLDELRPLK